jgi:RNA polymerase sigma-70 factor (ECF subfamily)
MKRFWRGSNSALAHALFFSETGRSCDSMEMCLSLPRPGLLDTNADEIERRWIVRAQAGEASALDWVVRQHAALVERMLVRMLGRRQDLDDLIQNTFVETLRALPAFRGQSAFASFVAGIAVRVARRAMRPGLVTRFRAPLPDDELATQASAPDAQLEAQRRLVRLRAALEHLSEAKRVAFLLWSLEGLSPEQIAPMMEASVAATRSRIYYAQKELLARAHKDVQLREWLLERSHEQR